ncbi:hypothetical protein CRUP_009897 [Coryphaenoides rupestris]|nr:hypothetical protein CRUP_009897 [Coryphaenoides rupestris]
MLRSATYRSSRRTVRQRGMSDVESDREKTTIYAPRFGSQTNDAREYAIDTPPACRQKKTTMKKKPPKNGLSSKKFRKLSTFSHRASTETVRLNDVNNEYDDRGAAAGSHSTSCQGMVLFSCS